MVIWTSWQSLCNKWLPYMLMMTRSCPNVTRESSPVKMTFKKNPNFGYNFCEPLFDVEKCEISPTKKTFGSLW